MSNIYDFNAELFKAVYPKFANVDDTLLEFYFSKAESAILDNSETSCIALKERELLFFMLVAHYAELADRIKTGGGSIVGRASSASEGSVSVSFEYNMGKGALPQWLNQTPYGAEYWVATAKYRTGGYVVNNKAMPVQRFKYPNGGW